MHFYTKLVSTGYDRFIEHIKTLERLTAEDLVILSTKAINEKNWDFELFLELEKRNKSVINFLHQTYPKIESKEERSLLLRTLNRMQGYLRPHISAILKMVEGESSLKLKIEILELVSSSGVYEKYAEVEAYLKSNFASIQNLIDAFNVIESFESLSLINGSGLARTFYSDLNRYNEKEQNALWVAVNLNLLRHVSLSKDQIEKIKAVEYHLIQEGDKKTFYFIQALGGNASVLRSKIAEVISDPLTKTWLELDLIETLDSMGFIHGDLDVFRKIREPHRLIYLYMGKYWLSKKGIHNVDLATSTFPNEVLYLTPQRGFGYSLKEYAIPMWLFKKD
jgi:hypothetical protein